MRKFVAKLGLLEPVTLWSFNSRVLAAIDRPAHQRQQQSVAPNRRWFGHNDFNYGHWFFWNIGAGDGIRTHDPNLGKVVLYH